MIQKCPGCKPNAYMDKRYGQHMRVHTPFTTKAKIAMARCVVCLSEKPADPTAK